MIFTPFAGLIQPDENDSVSVDNNGFFEVNPTIIDQFLKIGAVTHRHDAHPALPNPSTAMTGSVSVSGGALPSSTPFFVTYTLVDAYGGETAAASALALVTPDGVGAPTDLVVATPDYTGGILPAGDYFYAKTYTDGAGGETPIGDATLVYVDPGFASAQVQISNLMADAPDTAVTARLWRSYEGADWHLATETGSDTYTDTGFDPPDNPALPPEADNTNQTNLLSVTIPSDPAMTSACVAINVYFSSDESFPNPSFLEQVPTSSAGSVLTITSMTVSAGAPPAFSRASRGAAKIDPDADMLDFPWKRPVATLADLPTTGNENGDVRIVLAPREFATWNASTNTWTTFQSPWKLPVPTFADLSSVGNNDGDVRETLDDHRVYTWDADTDTWILIGEGGGGGGSIEILDEHGNTVAATGSIEFTGSGGVQVYVDDLGSGSGAVRIGEPLWVPSAQDDGYEFVAADAHHMIEYTATSSGMMTIPTEDTVPYPVGTEIALCQMHAGQVAVQGDIGVGVHAPSGMYGTRDQYAIITARKRDTDDWVLWGRLGSAAAGGSGELPGIISPDGIASTVVFATPTVASGPVFAHDTFTDTDGTDLSAHTPEIGVSWTNFVEDTTGHIVINGGKVRAAGEDYVTYYTFHTAPDADYEVTVDTIGGSAGGTDIGIWARFDPAAWGGYHLHQQSGVLTLSVGTAGTFTTLDSVAQVADETITLKVEGDTISAIVGGVTVLTATDSTYTAAGHVGLRGWYNGVDNAQADNFTAQTLP